MGHYGDTCQGNARKWCADGSNQHRICRVFVPRLQCSFIPEIEKISVGQCIVTADAIPVRTNEKIHTWRPGMESREMPSPF